MARTITSKHDILDLKWIRASSAYNILCQTRKNPVEVSQILAQYLRDGRIRARAKSIWISDENLMSKAWKSNPDSDMKSKDVKRAYWQSNKNWLNDRESWIWTKSRFHLTTKIRPIKRRMMTGVTLNVEDLKKVLPEEFGEPKRKRGGPQPSIVIRTFVWKFLLELALDDVLEDVWRHKPQEDLVGFVYDSLAERGQKVGVCTVRETVKYALQVLDRRAEQVGS